MLVLHKHFGYKHFWVDSQAQTQSIYRLFTRTVFENRNDKPFKSHFMALCAPPTK